MRGAVAIAWTVCSLVILFLSRAACAGGTCSEAVVGAIRWDGWFEGGSYAKFLAPAQWHDRLPFYAKITQDGGVEVVSDSQEIMDQEIHLAQRAGLGFWAFCYYHPSSWPQADSYNYGWKLFLSSEKRKDLRFCFILQGGSHMGPAQDWDRTVDGWIQRFKDPAYQRVLGQRPLLFIFGCEKVEPHFGSAEAAKQAFGRLRTRCAEEGAGDPYIVAMVFSAQEGKRLVEALGWDAVSAYSAPGWGAHECLPYQSLAEANVRFWESLRETGKSVIPLVNAGWDARPRMGDPSLAKHYGGPWYSQPNPQELGAHIEAALDWMKAYPKAAETRAILIYAWNETDEGGWLVPTRKEGKARIKALRKILVRERG